MYYLLFKTFVFFSSSSRSSFKSYSFPQHTTHLSLLAAQFDQPFQQNVVMSIGRIQRIRYLLATRMKSKTLTKAIRKLYLIFSGKKGFFFYLKKSLLWQYSVLILYLIFKTKQSGSGPRNFEDRIRCKIV